MAADEDDVRDKDGSLRSSDDMVGERRVSYGAGLVQTRLVAVTVANALLASGETGRLARSSPVTTRRLRLMLESDWALDDEYERAGDGGTDSSLALTASLGGLYGDLDGGLEGGSDAGGERMAPASAGERGRGPVGVGGGLAGRRKRTV